MKTTRMAATNGDELVYFDHEEGGRRYMVRARFQQGMAPLDLSSHELMAQFLMDKAKANGQKGYLGDL